MAARVKANWGPDVIVSDDRDQYPAAVADVALWLDGQPSVLLTPKQARKLARELKRRAKLVEAHNERVGR